jgi:hypothetical protein
MILPQHAPGANPAGGSGGTRRKGPRRAPPLIVLPVAIICCLSAWFWLANSLHTKLAADSAANGAATVAPDGGPAGAAPPIAALNFVPASIDELRASADALRGVVDAHRVHFTLLFCAAYVLKQALCVPGSVALNAFAGAAFGTAVGIPLTVAMTVVGVCCCYSLSWLFLGRLGNRWGMEERILPLRMQV